jgi:hypothetical protein
LHLAGPPVLSSIFTVNQQGNFPVEMPGPKSERRVNPMRAIWRLLGAESCGIGELALKKRPSVNNLAFDV